MELSQATSDFIRAHANDDVRALALQAGKYPDIDMPTVIVQIAGQQAAREKIPLWASTTGILYPRHLSLEQCSSEVTARYKASLVAGKSFADLTGGFGIDCVFMAANFEKATYVERQEELCAIASHNFPLLGLPHITVHNGDGVDYLQSMEPVDWIFIDPARRNEHGGKTVRIADCEPDVVQLEEQLLAKSRQVLVKLSPMLDLSLALQELQHVCQAHIVSVSNECKELLLLLSQESVPEVPIHCVNLTPKGDQAFVFTRKEEQSVDCRYTSSLGAYLYEPNASLLKGGSFRSIAQQYKVSKLHPNSHLYTSDKLVESFPGRIFRIRAFGSFNKKEMKELLDDTRKAHLTVRNFPATVADLRKRLKLNEGGDTYLFATTLADENKVLIRCEKL